MSVKIQTVRASATGSPPLPKTAYSLLARNRLKVVGRVSMRRVSLNRGHERTTMSHFRSRNSRPALQ